MMELHDVGQVLAERRYTLEGRPGPPKEVVVRIGVPQRSPDGGSHFCPFEIVGVGTPKVRYIFGEDPFQALKLTLKMVGSTLHDHRQHYGPGFYLYEAGDDLGFPEEAYANGPADQIVRAFGPVYGLKLSIARNVGNMKGFHFGAIKPHPSGQGTVGQYALHISCPWRIVAAECRWRVPSEALLITGSGDWYEPSERDDDFDWDLWNERRTVPSLQVKILERWFQWDPATKSQVNTTDLLFVQQVEADDYGGLDIHLSGGFRLQVFPNRRANESWRLFEPDADTPHFVFCDGAAENGH